MANNSTHSEAVKVRLEQLESKVKSLEDELKELSREVLVLKINASYKSTITTWLARNWWTLLVAAGLLIEGWVLKP